MEDELRIAESLEACFGDPSGSSNCQKCHEKYALGCNCSTILGMAAAAAIRKLSREASLAKLWRAVAHQFMEIIDREDKEWTRIDSRLPTLTVNDAGYTGYLLYDEIYDSYAIADYSFDKFGCGPDLYVDGESICPGDYSHWMPLAARPKDWKHKKPNFSEHTYDNYPL